MQEPRIYIDSYVQSKIIPQIDDLDFMKLGKSSCDRSDLFLFAVAIGIENGQRKPLKKRVDFIRSETLDYFKRATLRSILINQLIHDNEIENLDDDSLAYQYAEEYANTGFYVLNDMISTLNNGIDSNESYMLFFLQKARDLYNEIYDNSENK